VEISHAGEPVFHQHIHYARSFGYVDEGRPLLYPDSLQTIGLAVNSGNFASRFGINAGPDWTIRLIKPTPPD
jgi:S-adenosylmethionine hydrolase